MNPADPLLSLATIGLLRVGFWMAVAVVSVVHESADEAAAQADRLLKAFDARWTVQP